MATPLHLKPPVAGWIVRERRRLGLKPRDIAAQLAGMGLEVTEATVKVWESNADRRPSAYNLEGLERIFGSQAPLVPNAATLDQASVIEAIDRLTQAQEAQSSAVSDRLDRIAGSLDGLADALLDLATRLTREHVGNGASSGSPRAETR